MEKIGFNQFTAPWAYRKRTKTIRGTALALNTKSMSWSILFFGKPEKVAEALEAYSEKLSGVSLEEYEKALPNMVNLVKQNFGNEAELVKISASGHGYFVDGVAKQGHTNVEITSVYGVLV